MLKSILPSLLIAQLVVLGLLFVPNTTLAVTTEVECPEEIKTKQTPITPPKGWATHVDATNARQLFTGLAIYDGHPKDGATLFADESAEGGSDASAGALYKIPAGRDGYLVCQYTNTLVRLIKKLPKDIQSCRVKFSETLGHVQKAVCE